jgi:hypothetical protein
MAGMNFRGVRGFDPENYGGNGGLLGMLQAVMQQSQVQPGAELNPEVAGNNGRTPTVPRWSEDGQTPRTRIIVRPIGAYPLPDSEKDGGEGGLLDRLLALQAEQSRYQPTPLNSGQTSSAPYDPNFRQLSRAPVASRPQEAIAPFNQPDDQSSPSYPPFGGSASLAPPRMSRQEDKAPQSDRSLSDRLQASWDHPHPWGVVARVKEAINGIAQVVQGSIDATSEPSTEEDAFRQNWGREQGPIGAWNAVSLLSPGSPGGTGGIFARPVADALRYSLPALPTAPRIAERIIDARPANTGAPAVGLVSGERNLSPQPPNPAALADAITAPAGVDPQPLPPTAVSTFPDWLAEAAKIRQKYQRTPSSKGGGGKGGSRAKSGGGGDGEDCYDRENAERDRCDERMDDYAHLDFLAACKQRASDRRNLCVKNGGRPDPLEPKEWGLPDEEIWRNFGR